MEIKSGNRHHKLPEDILGEITNPHMQPGDIIGEMRANHIEAGDMLPLLYKKHLQPGDVLGEIHQARKKNGEPEYNPADNALITALYGSTKGKPEASIAVEPANIYARKPVEPANIYARKSVGPKENGGAPPDVTIGAPNGTPKSYTEICFEKNHQPYHSTYVPPVEKPAEVAPADRQYGVADFKKGLADYLSGVPGPFSDLFAQSKQPKSYWVNMLVTLSGTNAPTDQNPPTQSIAYFGGEENRPVTSGRPNSSTLEIFKDQGR